MEKDTKEEPIEEPIEDLQDDAMGDDDYDDYIIGKSLGNFKDDPASKRNRPRNIPVSKLTITDEEKIPKMPETILKEPNEKELNAKLKDLEEKIKAKQNNINELKKKKNAKWDEINGINDKQKNERKDVEEAVKNLVTKKKEKEKEFAEILKKVKEANDELKSYEKLGVGISEKKILTEIKQIQEHLSFEDISVPEEKRLNERKYELENFLKVVRRCKPIKDAAKEPTAEINKIRTELKAAIDKRNAFYEKNNIAKPDKNKKKKVEESKEKDEKEKRPENPEINQLNLQIESLIKDKKALIEEKRKIEEEFNEKYYEWQNQRNLIDYIKRATDKIKALKQKESREKKKKLKEEKKSKEAEGEDFEKPEIEVAEKPKMKDPKLRMVENLEEYFTDIMNKGKETQKEEVVENFEREKSKMDDDLAKGKLKKFERDETFGFELGLKDSQPEGGKKKKGKKPKMSARTMQKENLLSLDVNILEKFRELGLTPPRTKEDIPKFMEQLKAKKEALIQGNAPVPEEKKEGTEEVAKEEGLKALADMI